MTRLPRLFGLGLFSLLLSAQMGRPALAQPVTVTAHDAIVVNHAAPLRIGSQTVARLDMGSVFKVQQTNGDWRGGAIQLNNEWKTGWLKESDLVRRDEALKHFDQVVARQSRDFRARMVRARLLRDAGQLDRAIADYDVAVQLQPKESAAYTHRGYARFAQGNYEPAIEDYNRALAINPKDALSYTNRGTSYQSMGNYRRALSDYDAAVGVAAKNALALNNAAWIRATCPVAEFRDGKKAVAGAERACQLTDSKNHVYLDTLAAAQAEAGQFEQAVATAKQAAQLTPESERAAIAARLRLYSQQKPFRDDN